MTRTEAKSLLAALALVVLAQAAMAQQVPSQMLNQYKAQRTTWMTNVWPYANNLFFWLALIEFTWSAAVMLLERTDLQSWTAALVRRIMWIGAFYALLLNGRTWVPAIIDSFNLLGQQASGSGPMSPSDVFMRGINIAGSLMDGASTSAFFTNPGTSLALVVAAALTVLSFIFITVQFVVAMVESYVIVAAGVIFLGFGGSRWTAPYVERYIGLGVSNGVKIMLLYLLVGTGMNVSVSWISDAQAVGASATPAMSAFEIMGASLIFLMLCWQIPKLFSAVMGGSPLLTGGDLVATGAAVATGAVALGSVAVSAGSSLAAAGAGSGATAGGGSGVLSGVASTQANGGGAVPPPPAPPPSSGGGPQPPPQPGPGTPGSAQPGSQEPPSTAPTQSTIKKAARSMWNYRAATAALPSDDAPQAAPPRMPIHDADE